MPDSLPLPAPPLTEDQKAALRLMLAQYWPLYEEYRSNYRGIEEAQKYIAKTEARQADIQSEVQQMQRVGLRMGVDMYAAAEAVAGDDDNQSEAQSQVAPQSPRQELSVKHFVLAEAQDAWPKPVRATALNLKLRQMGHDVHPKSVGMSLYRWLKKGLVRREGLDWYYVESLPAALDLPLGESEEDDPRDYE